MKDNCVKVVRFTDAKVEGKSVNGNIAEVLINITGDWIFTGTNFFGDNLFVEGPCMLFKAKNRNNQTVQRKMMYKKYDTYDAPRKLDRQLSCKLAAKGAPMKKQQRKTYTTEFKVKVVLEAFKGQRTINEISSHYGIHPNQVNQWKKQAVESLPDVFSSRRARAAEDEEALKGQLYQQIGQLKVELDWLKKKAGLFS